MRQKTVTNLPDEQHQSNPKGSSSEIVRLAIIAISYFAATYFGLCFVAQPEGVTSVWPPSGIAIAALILTERRKWLRVSLVIFAANIIGNLVGGNSLPVSFGFGLANIAEAILSAWALVHICGPKITFERTIEVISLGFVAVVINGLVAFLGAAVPSLAFGAPYFHTWFVWWIADGLGIILITPVIVSWLAGTRSALSRRQLVEAGILLVLVFSLSLLGFSPAKTNQYQLIDVYLIFLLLIWAAMRLNQTMTATLIFVFASISIWQTIYGVGSGSAASLLEHEVLPIQLLISIITFTALIIASTVTERRWALNGLQENEDRLSLAIKASHLALWDWSLLTNELVFSTEWKRQIGYEEHEISNTSETWESLLHPEDRQRVLDKLRAYMDGREQEYEVEFRLRHQDGSYRWIYARGQLQYDENGKPYRILGCHLDITERRKKDNHAEYLRKLHELILSTAGEGIYGLDTKGITTFVNPAAAKMIGWKPDELIGLHQHSVLHHSKNDGSPYPVTECPIYATFHDGNVHLVENEVFWRKDGSSFPVEYTSTPIKNAEGETEGAVIVFRDITERNKAEETLKIAHKELEKKVEERTAELHLAYEQLKSTQNRIIQQEKLASIGQIAAGVAHEINNPTGFVASNLSSLKKYIHKLISYIEFCSNLIKEKNDEVSVQKLLTQQKSLRIDFLCEDIQNLIDESIDGTSRISKIVQGLKNFARPDQKEYLEADINECLETTINIVWNELKYKCELIREYGDVTPLKCYPQQLNQVFMNLLVNAAYSIENQGKITIKSWQDNGLIHVSVADTGSGIPKENISRLFDPFFTTKPVGKGTGLGLSISYDIIKKHHGEILVESEVGKGSTFSVILPVNKTDISK
jgi:PAS domain S-box-containing protein